MKHLWLKISLSKMKRNLIKFGGLQISPTWRIFVELDGVCDYFYLDLGEIPIFDLVWKIVRWNLS